MTWEQEYYTIPVLHGQEIEEEICMKDKKIMGIVHAIEDLDIIAEQLEAVAEAFGARFVDDSAEYCGEAVKEHYDRYAALFAVITRYIGEIGGNTRAILEMANAL